MPAGSRYVLRLWPADIDLTNGKPAPLWVGSIVEECLYRPFSLLTLTWTLPDMNRPRQVLAAALDGGRVVSRAGAPAGADWDGRVLLARKGDERSTAQ